MFHSEICGLDVTIRLVIDGEEIEPHDSRFAVALRPAGGGDLAGTLTLAVGHARGELFRIDKVTITFKVPVHDIHRVRTALSERGEGHGLPQCLQWRCGAQQGMPFVTFTNRAGRNRLAVGLLDHVTETRFRVELLPSERAFAVTIEKPAGPCALHTKRWREALHVSRRDGQWSVALRDYLAAASETGQYEPAPTPSWAFDPVFSTWYAVQQQVEPDWVERNAQIAHSLGFGTLALGNGWFSARRDGSLADAGDWQPNQALFPDFPAHVRRVKAIGMRCLLWTAPFVVGRQSRAHAELDHLLLDVGAADHDVLCPRTTETHERIAAVAKRLMTDSGADGLTLDLVDAVWPATCAGAHDHQFATIGEGVFAALQSLQAAVTQVRPDAVISLSQSGANLAGRCCANVFRAAPAPLDYDTNRRRIAALRACAGDAAVHGDAVYWRSADDTTDLSRHLISALFAVPVLSAGLEWAPDAELAMIRHWLGFYAEHRQALCHGRLRTVLDDCGCPMLAAISDEEAVVAVFSDAVPALHLPQTVSTIYLLNASDSEDVCIRLQGTTAELDCELFDAFGAPTGQPLRARPPFLRLSLPIGAYARLTQC